MLKVAAFMTAFAVERVGGRPLGTSLAWQSLTMRVRKLVDAAGENYAR